MTKKQGTFFCPFRAGISCDHETKRVCITCGWYPVEEDRRKEILRQLIGMGQYNGKLMV